jgi:hypothetical protein
MSFLNRRWSVSARTCAGTQFHAAEFNFLGLFILIGPGHFKANDAHMENIQLVETWQASTVYKLTESRPEKLC